LQFNTPSDHIPFNTNVDPETLSTCIITRGLRSYYSTRTSMQPQASTLTGTEKQSTGSRPRLSLSMFRCPEAGNKDLPSTTNNSADNLLITLRTPRPPESQMSSSGKRGGARAGSDKCHNPSLLPSSVCFSYFPFHPLFILLPFIRTLRQSLCCCCEQRFELSTLTVRKKHLHPPTL